MICAQLSARKTGVAELSRLACVRHHDCATATASEQACGASAGLTHLGQGYELWEEVLDERGEGCHREQKLQRLVHLQAQEFGAVIVYVLGTASILHAVYLGSVRSSSAQTGYHQLRWLSGGLEAKMCTGGQANKLVCKQGGCLPFVLYKVPTAGSTFNLAHQ